MAFFSRHRLRWREQRLDRKLRELNALRGVARTGLNYVLTHRVVIEPVAKTDNATPNGKESWQSKRRRAATTLPPSVPLWEENQVAFVHQYNAQRWRTFADDEKELLALQQVVPSTKHRVDEWIDKQRRCLRMRVRTARDLARWMQTHSSMHDELVRIHDLVMSSARLHVVDRKRAITEPVVSADQQQSPATLSLARSVALPHPEICITMVVAAILFGAYGLVVLGLVLKFMRKI